MEHRSIDKTRNDCVDTNTIGGDIARKALGQAEQCALGGAVNTDLGQTDDRGLGGDEHYAAVLLLTHVRDGGLTERESAVKMNVHKIVEVLNGDVGDLFLAVASGVVYKKIAGAVGVDDLLDKLGRGVCIRNVMYIVVYILAELIACLLEQLFTAAGDNDRRACGCEALRNGVTQTRAAAGDKRNLPTEIKCFVKILVHDDPPFGF